MVYTGSIDCRDRLETKICTEQRRSSGAPGNHGWPCMTIDKQSFLMPTCRLKLSVMSNG